MRRSSPVCGAVRDFLDRNPFGYGSDLRRTSRAPSEPHSRCSNGCERSHGWVRTKTPRSSRNSVCLRWFRRLRFARFRPWPVPAILAIHASAGPDRSSMLCAFRSVRISIDLDIHINPRCVLGDRFSECDHIVAQRVLIAFHGQQVVSSVIHHRLCSLALAVHRIGGHDHPCNESSPSSSRTAGISLDGPSTASCASTRHCSEAQARTRCRGDC